MAQMTRISTLVSTFLLAGLVACGEGETDTDDQTEALVSCIDCHQNQEMLITTAEPEDTDDPGGESSGEG